MVLYKGFRTYDHGADFEIAGRTFHIQKNYKEGASSKGKLKNNIMQLYLASGMTEREEQEHSSYLVSKLIGTAFLPEVRQRLEALNIQHFQKPIGRVRLRNNVSNWGSCSHDGNLSISTRLLFAPYETVEYVLIHELAHLVEHNHSDRFWKQVERVMPDYKRHEKWLDKNGDKCQF
jgi:predicted metal-dependent hydrolase